MAILLDMKENQKKAFDFAADVTKQLITLSTAIITITITFSKDIVNFVDTSVKNYLLWAWILFIATVFFGIWTLLALTGNLQPLKKEKNNDDASESKKNNVNDYESECSINSINIRIPSMLQILCFIIALIFTIVYGFHSLDHEKKDTSTKSNNKELKIIRKTEYTVSPTLTIDTLIVK